MHGKSVHFQVYHSRSPYLDMEGVGPLPLQNIFFLMWKTFITVGFSASSVIPLFHYKDLIRGKECCL